MIFRANGTGGINNIGLHAYSTLCERICARKVRRAGGERGKLSYCEVNANKRQLRVSRFRETTNRDAKSPIRSVVSITAKLSRIGFDCASIESQCFDSPFEFRTGGFLNPTILYDDDYYMIQLQFSDGIRDRCTRRKKKR